MVLSTFAKSVLLHCKRYRGKGLYIWVEGDDDVRFFEHVIKPRLAHRYSFVIVTPYANRTTEKVRQFIHSIDSMGADYMFVGDKDDCPCISDKKKQIVDRYQAVKTERIVVVVREIESWLVAGVAGELGKQLEGDVPNNTDSVTKTQCQEWKPKQCDSHLDFKLEILNSFSVNTAAKRNSSFLYFTRKYSIE